MARARVRVPRSLEGFTRSDWERVIYEAALGVEDTRIAELYLLDAVAQADIGAEMRMDRSTVSRRLIRIIDKIERISRRLTLV